MTVLVDRIRFYEFENPLEVFVKGRSIPVLFLGFLLLTINGAVFAQVADEEPFIDSLRTSLHRQGWDSSETDALEKLLSSFPWNNTDGIDSDIIALALTYAKHNGVDSNEELAGVAYQLVDSVREMNAIGLTNRESAKAILNGLRMTGFDEPDLQHRIREQIQTQVNETGGAAVRQRVESRIEWQRRPSTWSPTTPKGSPSTERNTNPPRTGDKPGAGGKEGGGKNGEK